MVENNYEIFGCSIILRSPGKYPYGPQDNLFDVVETLGDPTAWKKARLLLSGESGRATYYNQSIRYYIFYAPLQGTDWYMVTICPYSHIYEGLHHFNLINASLPVIKTGDKMKALYQAFSHMQQKLSNYISNLEKATQAKEKIESELRIAHDIQMSTLPQAYPSFPGRTEVELYVTLFPSRQVGGDFYDYFSRNKYLYFAISDVSGKGLPASLLMASTISLLRSLSSTLYSPAFITNTLNNSIAEQDNDLFVTFFIGQLNIDNGELKYCNAGHIPPVLTHPHGMISLLDVQPELPLGILQGHEYKEYAYQFSNGFGILLYTDGVTDAENKAREFYGKARLLQLIRQNHTLHPHEFIHKILENIYRHVTTRKQSDDLSMLTLIYGSAWEIKNSEKNVSSFWKEKIKIYLCVVQNRKTVQWCNGSTTDSGPVSPSSNLG